MPGVSRFRSHLIHNRLVVITSNKLLLLNTKQMYLLGEQFFNIAFLCENREKLAASGY